MEWISGDQFGRVYPVEGVFTESSDSSIVILGSRLDEDVSL